MKSEEVNQSSTTIRKNRTWYLTVTFECSLVLVFTCKIVIVPVKKSEGGV